MSSVRHFDEFDRTDGNGSRSAEEDWLDENTTAAENEWSTAETTFHYWEVSNGHSDKYKKLYDAHHGKGESDRKSTIRRSEIVSDAETFSNILELPEPQTTRVTNIAQKLNFSSRRFGGKTYEKVILAICSLVSDQALSQKLDHNNLDSGAVSKRIVLDDSFRELMEVNELGSREHNRIRQMLREKTELFD